MLISANTIIKRSSYLILLAVCLCLPGCLESTSSPYGSAKMDTPDGMIAYLEAQRLPALKSVENWPNKFGPGLKLTTAHYDVYTTLLEPLMLSQVPGFVESAYRGYQSQLPSPIKTNTRLTIYLFANRQQWEDFTGPQAPLYLKIKAGAYFLKGDCIVYNIGRERTFATIGHEGWHQFNSRHFKYRLPSWLDEGIAMQFEISKYDRGLFTFQPGRNLYRLGSLKKTLINNKTIPLQKLIAMNPGEAVIDSDDTVAAFYSQAYALVRFLREDDYGKRLADYQKLLYEGLAGQWPIPEQFVQIASDRNIPMTVRWNKMVGTAMFEHYIEDNLNDIEAEYLTFCRKIVYPVRLK